MCSQIFWVLLLKVYKVINLNFKNKKCVFCAEFNLLSSQLVSKTSANEFWYDSWGETK